MNKMTMKNRETDCGMGILPMGREKRVIPLAWKLP